MFKEGDRIIVIEGRYKGRVGSIALTYDSEHKIVAKLLALRADTVRIVLDRSPEGSWSGVVSVSELKHVRLETDAELYARMVEAHVAWRDHVRVCHGETLDEAAKFLKLQRREVPDDNEH